MTTALLVKPAAWRSRRHRRVLNQLVASGAHCLSGNDLPSLAQEIADLGAGTTVVACGGDGTVHLALNAIAGLDVTLAVVPMGTGNDFARHLGLRSTSQAIAALHDGFVRTIDSGLIEWPGGTRRYAGVASCGFDAQVNERANRLRGPEGTVKYLVALVGELRSLSALNLELAHDGVRDVGRWTLVAVGNTSSYGGGMRICPTATCDDGQFEVTRVDEVSRHLLMRVLPRVFTGAHVRHPAVSQLNAQNVQLSGSDFPVYADGEKVGHGPVTIRVEPGALRVVVPSGFGSDL